MSCKVNKILLCDWLPERERWRYIARSRLPSLSRKKNFPESHIINHLLTKLVRSRWLDIREVEHDVYGKRQTAKTKLLPSLFICVYS